MCEWRRNEKCETLVVVGACNRAPSLMPCPRIFRQAAARANQRLFAPSVGSMQTWSNNYKKSALVALRSS